MLLSLVKFNNIDVSDCVKNTKPFQEDCNQKGIVENLPIEYNM